jgi:hypothetical protein
MLPYQERDVRGVRAENPEWALKGSEEPVVQPDTVRKSGVFC